jgi:hypothetical protein
MFTTDALQNWIGSLDRRAYGALVGVGIGAAAGISAIVLVLLGPLYTFVGLIAALAGLIVITNLELALYTVIAVMVLLPFGTFPFQIGFTPTLLDLAIGVLLVVYLTQWMTGRRRTIQIAPVHALIVLYILWLILSFVLGLRHSPLSFTVLRQFTTAVISIGLTLILSDILRSPALLRRLVVVILALVAAQAVIGLGLYVLPDATAEAVLNRLARIGYPAGGVIRYIESNPALAERAIGTWVDPNAYGGLLAISAVIIAPQIFAAKPILRERWLTFGVFALTGLMLYLTYSRASMLALASGLGVVALARYRRFIPLLILAAALILLLPQTQAYIERFIQAFTGADLATQMRLGEYSDSLRLISRYPFFGVGFTGTPDIDIYTDVASMYLIMANQIGLLGVSIFLLAIAGVFVYGLTAWQTARHNPTLDALVLGYHAALLTALVNAAADLYFFRIDFQASITLFWLTVGLAVASSRLAIRSAREAESALKSTVVKTLPIE